MFMVSGVGGGHSSMKEGGREPVGPPLTSSTLRIGKQSYGSASLFHVAAVNCLQSVSLSILFVTPGPLTVCWTDVIVSEHPSQVQLSQCVASNI